MGVRKAGTSASHKRKAGRKIREASQIPIEQYDHKKKLRLNNPPVGLINRRNDQAEPRTKYQFDPHLDPILNWAGKTEHLSFQVPTVSLHVHERIDARTIIETVRKTNTIDYEQMSLFNNKEERRPLREEVEFYKHRKNWSNRLIAGDSLLVMNSLLEKEGMAEKVQMIYLDPPYGIKYGSNFQPFINKRSVTDGKDEDLNSEPETVRAFRDTWELGIHSYLTYLRDRLLLAKELLTESGSIFVQINDENLHLVRSLLDEVFGPKNFASLITFQKTTGSTTTTLQRTSDYLLLFAKNIEKFKFRKLYEPQTPGMPGATEYNRVELPDGSVQPISKFFDGGRLVLPKGAKVFTTGDITSKGGDDPDIELKWKGQTFKLSCKPNRHWKPGVEGIKKLWDQGRLLHQSGLRIYKRYLDDFPFREITHVWNDTRGEASPSYVVQTHTKVIERCIQMTTDPGDLVFDPTCGSGTTAYSAEQWGRRWITCDTSRVAVTLAKQRLMTSHFDYYTLEHPEEGVDSGIRYKKLHRITLGSLANGEPPEQVTLFDQPEVDLRRVRVTGPFTVEAVPAPVVKPLTENKWNDDRPDLSVARSGETSRQSDWRDELLKTGVRAKNKHMLEFSRIESLPGTRWLHAIGEVKESTERVAMSFGPEYAPLEQRQVELAIEEAQTIVPRPTILIFAAFQFDPEAAKDIDQINWPGVQVLKVQMNPDLFTADLKKKRVSNESFWLVGQPDVGLRKIESGENKGMFEIEVKGFDYYNPKSGSVDSGGAKNIAVWMLDVDYDGRSLFPRQVFFPLGGTNDGWKRLAKSLQSEIDEELIQQYEGTISVPFESGEYKRVAVKIIDDRGIESLRILEIDQ
jgi:adenine-specific DNA-methyltransferase